MEIKPNEVESVKTIGSLFNDDVKLIKTIGGFYVAVGKKTRYKKEVEPLAAGSHFALVNHQIEKEYKSEYQPIVMKSEGEILPVVEEFTDKLPQHMVNEGFQVYTLTKNDNINLVATKLGVEVANLEGQMTLEGFTNVKRISKSQDYDTKHMSKICFVFSEIINERF